MSRVYNNSHMKRILISFFLAFCVFLFLRSTPSFAIEDPLSLQNNKIGVHILFPQEIDMAADLVNASGGDWGYVVIPVQAGDRDLNKWQKFMDDARKLHVIPIVRLATEGDYFNTTVWRKPSGNDVLDFANFLNSLDWPVKNRYVVVFNEVNRSDEWEGNLDPEEYAKILNLAVLTFKSLNKDFFIISGGLDNAAPNIAGKYMNEYDYMVAMDNAVPGIFGLIDGLGSHSYPNPGFKQPPYLLTKQSICSFSFEKELADRLGNKNLPVFITETGWSKEVLSENQIAQYFKYALEHVWSDKSIVTVSSFLLKAGTKPFSWFSLEDESGKINEIYLSIAKLPKTKGNPTVPKDVGSLSHSKSAALPLKAFPKNYQYGNELLSNKTNAALNFFKWLFKLYV